jgi:hypothetical protein
MLARKLGQARSPTLETQQNCCHCMSVQWYQRLGSTCCLHVLGKRIPRHWARLFETNLIPLSSRRKGLRTTFFWDVMYLVYRYQCFTGDALFLHARRVSPLQIEEVGASKMLVPICQKAGMFKITAINLSLGTYVNNETDLHQFLCIHY